jgi:hypothetical protein
MSDFGEEGIRRIVREELKILLANIAETAERERSLGSLDDPEDAAFAAIAKTVERNIQDWDHKSGCYSRKEWGPCDCGLVDMYGNKIVE